MCLSESVKCENISSTGQPIPCTECTAEYDTLVRRFFFAFICSSYDSSHSCSMVAEMTRKDVKSRRQYRSFRDVFKGQTRAYMCCTNKHSLYLIRSAIGRSYVVSQSRHSMSRTFRAAVSMAGLSATSPVTQSELRTFSPGSHETGLVLNPAVRSLLRSCKL